MKKKIFYTVLFSALYFAACKKTDPVVPNTDNAIGDVWVNLPGYNTANYSAVFNTTKDSAFVEIPYYYPVDSDNEMDLKKMLVRMNIPFDAKVTPSLSQQIDLTNPVKITLTSGSGETKSFVLSVRKIGDYSIKKIRIAYGTKDTVDGLINGTDVLFFIVPGTDVSAAKLLYELNPHSTANIANNGTVNLSNPQSFVVSGADGRTVTYSLKAQEPRRLAYGIGIYRKLWYKTAAQIPSGGMGTASNQTAIAISGNNLLILNNLAALSASPGVIKVYDRITMDYVRDLAVPPVPGVRFFGMCNDSIGNVLVSSFTPSGNFYIYKYSSAADNAPVKLVQYTFAGPGTSLGRALRVYGDVSKNAIITSHTSGNGNIYKWTVTNGVLVSNTPEVITYASLLMPNGSTTSWGNYAEAIATSTAPNTNYFLSYPGELAYVNGTSNTRISGYPVQTPSGVTYQYPITSFKFNNANYLMAEFMKGATMNTAYFSIYDVTDVSKFGTPSAKILDSDLSEVGASNGNATGDVAAVVSADGTKAHVYMMLTNGGIMCYELTVYAAN